VPVHGQCMHVQVRWRTAHLCARVCVHAQTGSSCYEQRYSTSSGDRGIEGPCNFEGRQTRQARRPRTHEISSMIKEASTCTWRGLAGLADATVARTCVRLGASRPGHNRTSWKVLQQKGLGPHVGNACMCAVTRVNVGGVHARLCAYVRTFFKHCFEEIHVHPRENCSILKVRSTPMGTSTERRGTYQKSQALCAGGLPLGPDG